MSVLTNHNFPLGHSFLSHNLLNLNLSGNFYGLRDGLLGNNYGLFGNNYGLLGNSYGLFGNNYGLLGNHYGLFRDNRLMGKHYFRMGMGAI